MSKSEIAASFLRLAASGRVREAYEKHVSQAFTHHNPYFRGDRESLLIAMEEAHKASPNKSLSVKQAFADGDTVITHSLVIRQNPDEPEVAAVHIFRFAGDKIAELWDIGQEIPKDSPNENGAF
ncbi:MAG TPA: nuclear transport factor 2 family protein [Candidatus Nanoarchaeia archaeon]|nr:nuclear transport factor 2 family protein [Candidatus Nanoarchaeia archaeon]